MNRIQHVKMVSPAAAEIAAFLRDVGGLPGGFEIPSYGSDPLGHTQTRAKVPPTGPDLSWDDIASMRGGNGQDGFIAGSVESRQLQILPGETPGIWAVAIGTRDLEGVYERCRERGLATTPIEATPFVDSMVRAFFVVVGGITFEFMRVEPAD
ncbi:MAG: hypothetical protein ABW122_13215 [Ilumatobacteraceae bacterium]